MRNFFGQGVLDRSKSVIDIGAWISDNSIVWAKQISATDALVYAIDPSEDNIKFGRLLGVNNNVNNIEWHTCVCTDQSGVPLDFTGDLGHTSFRKSSFPTDKSIISTTIDEIVGEDRFNSIGMMHVDVEGFEENVLLGSLGVIEASRPIIVFEQHIKSEDVEIILRLIERFGYRTMMINEILLGCAADCRNLVAFPDDTDFDHVNAIAATTKTCAPHMPAVAGPALVEITEGSIQYG